jgi:hypothetical protein
MFPAGWNRNDLCRTLARLVTSGLLSEAPSRQAPARCLPVQGVEEIKAGKNS